jgi:hypothetical protein
MVCRQGGCAQRLKQPVCERSRTLPMHFSSGQQSGSRTSAGGKNCRAALYMVMAMRGRGSAARGPHSSSGSSDGRGAPG